MSRDEGSRAAEILTQVPGLPPRFSVGDAVTGTDEDGQVQVLVDGPDSSSTDEDTTDGDANQPIIARCWGNSVAQGERVNVVTLPDGSSWVVGSTAGQPRCIGASAIPGGATDVTIVSTAATAISDLDTDAGVKHPSHLVGVDVNVFLQSNGANNTLVGRVRRIDEDGTSSEVGRFLRSTDMANNQTIEAGVRVYDWAPEPGQYTYRATVQAAVTGWTMILSPNTTPEVAASLVVSDLGPLPDSANLVT